MNGKLCQTFQEACKEYGLLDDDNEWHQVLQQCSTCGLAPQIRQLFVHIMVNCRVTDLKKLWNDHSVHMTDDIVLMRRKISGNPNLVLNEKQIEYFALAGNIFNSPMLFTYLFFICFVVYISFLEFFFLKFELYSIS